MKPHYKLLLTLNACFFAICMIVPSVLNAQFTKLPNPGYDGFAQRAKVLEDGRVYARNNFGVIAVSNDEGFTFEVIGEVPQLFDYTLVNGDLYAWTISNLFKFNGEEFEAIQSLTDGLRFMVAVDNQIFAFGYNTSLVSSDNGTSFGVYPAFQNLDFTGYGFSDGQFYLATAPLGGNSQSVHKYSENGWESYSTSEPIQKMVSFDGTLYASLNYILHQSTNGESWTPVSVGNAVVDRRNFHLSVIGDALIFGSRSTFSLRNTENNSFVNVDFNSALNPTRSLNSSEFAKNGKVYKGLNEQLISYDIAAQSWQVEQEQSVFGNAIFLHENYYYTSSEKQLYRRALNEFSWEKIYTETDPFATNFNDLVVTQSGRIIASQQNRPVNIFSDDQGATWTKVSDTPFGNPQFIQRNDSLFAGDLQGLWLSVDDGSTWSKVYDKNCSKAAFYLTNHIVCSTELVELTNFTASRGLNTRNRISGIASSYAELSTQSFLGTDEGLYKKPNGDDENWTTVLGQVNVIGFIEQENGLLILTNNLGFIFTGDEGETLDYYTTVIPLDYTNTNQPDELLITAADGYYLVDLSFFKGDPSLQAFSESRIVRTDTLVRQEFRTTVIPRGKTTRVWFEYGLSDGSSFEFTMQTEEQLFEATEDTLDVVAVSAPLAYQSGYIYRAVLAFDDGIRYSVTQSFRSGIKKMWERIDEDGPFDSYQKVLISRRGSIIAWGDQNFFIRSIDNGSSWEEFTPPHQIKSMIQAAGDTLFAGSTDGVFMYSTNEGSSWTIAANDSLPSTFNNAAVMQITYDVGNHRYFAIYGDRTAEQNNQSYLVTSQNAGNLWETLPDNLFSQGLFRRSIHADAHGTLWTTADANTSGDYFLYKSTDFGQTYIPVLQPNSTVSGAGNEIISIGSDTLFLSSEFGAYYSDDRGNTWNEAGFVYPQVDYSKQFGIVSVSNRFQNGFESGVVSISGKNYRQSNQANASRDFGVAETPIVRDADVSSNDMIVIATSDGVWRYLPGASALTQNPNPDDIFVHIEEEGEILPQSVRLEQNYPNPFNPSTTISFELNQAADVQLRVYNLMGQQVAVLANGRFSDGAHQIRFDASHLSTGVYIYQLQSGSNRLTKKMTLIK